MLVDEEEDDEEDEDDEKFLSPSIFILFDDVLLFYLAVPTFFNDEEGETVRKGEGRGGKDIEVKEEKSVPLEKTIKGRRRRSRRSRRSRR